MNRNNTAITITTILCALFFIVVGSCFSAFLYAGEIVKVENPKIVASQGISVFDESGNKSIETLELSKMKLGLKPADHYEVAAGLLHHLHGGRSVGHVTVSDDRNADGPLYPGDDGPVRLPAVKLFSCPAVYRYG